MTSALHMYSTQFTSSVWLKHLDSHCSEVCRIGKGARGIGDYGKGGGGGGSGGGEREGEEVIS